MGWRRGAAWPITSKPTRHSDRSALDLLAPAGFDHAEGYEFPYTARNIADIIEAASALDPSPAGHPQDLSDQWTKSLDAASRSLHIEPRGPDINEGIGIDF